MKNRHGRRAFQKHAKRARSIMTITFKPVKENGKFQKFTIPKGQRLMNPQGYTVVTVREHVVEPKWWWGLALWVNKNYRGYVVAEVEMM